MRGPVTEGGGHVAVVCGPRHPRLAAPVLLVGLLNPPQVHAFLRGRLAHGPQQISNHLVTVRRDADRLPRLQETRDHPGAGPGLPAPRRSLDRQDGMVEGRDQAAQRVEKVRAVGDQRRAGRLTRPGRGGAEEIPGGSAVVRGRKVFGQERVGETEEALAQDRVVDVLERHQRLRVRYLRRLPPLEIDRPRMIVERHDHASRLPGGRIVRRILHVDVMLLLRKPVAMDLRPLDRADHPLVLQAAERRPVLQQFFGTQAQAMEILPPHRLVLAPVKVEQVRQDPPRLLLRGSLRRLLRHTGHEPGKHRRDPLLQLGGLRARLVRLRHRPRHRLAGLPLMLRAQRLQPVSEPERGDAVIPVVPLDDRRQLLPLDVPDAQLEPRLELCQGAGGVPELHGALEAVERLHLLDGVTLHGRPHPLPHGPVQIDEHAAPEQPVHFLLAGGVASHQFPDRGLFVGGIVIHVHPGVFPETGHDAIDEPLELRPFRRAIQRPQRLVLSIGIHHAEQVLEPLLERVLVPLDIEEQVPRRRRRQRRQPLLGHHRQNLMEMRARISPLELNPRLFPYPRERSVADAVHPGPDRHLHHRQCRQCAHIPLHQPRPLTPRDPRHQRQMIILPPHPVTLRPPVADLTMLHRLRVRGGPTATPHLRLKPPPHRPVVSRVLVKKKRLKPNHRPPQRQPHLPRRHPLHPRQQIRIQRNLQHRPPLGLPRQLGVHNFIRPRPELTRSVHPNQKVRIPTPAPIKEPRLVDDVHTAPHGVDGELRAESSVFFVTFLRRSRGDFFDCPAEIAEVLKDSGFVLQAALFEGFGAGVFVGSWAGAVAKGDGEIQGGEVRAGEVVGEVGGGGEEGGVRGSHVDFPPSVGCGAPGATSPGGQ